MRRASVCPTKSGAGGLLAGQEWPPGGYESSGGPDSHRPAGFGDPALQEAAGPPVQAEACGTRGSGTGWEPVPPGRARERWGRAVMVGWRGLGKG